MEISGHLEVLGMLVDVKRSGLKTRAFQIWGPFDKRQRPGLESLALNNYVQVIHFVLFLWYYHPFLHMRKERLKNKRHPLLGNKGIYRTFIFRNCTKNLSSITRLPTWKIHSCGLCCSPEQIYSLCRKEIKYKVTTRKKASAKSAFSHFTNLGKS